MAFWGSTNAGRPASGSLLAGWLRRVRPHPDTFVCGFRWADGEPGTRQGWRYRRSWVDPLHDGDVLSMRHGDEDGMRIRLDEDPWWNGPGPAPRHGLAVLSGRSVDTGVRILLAVPPGELIRLGIDDH